MEHTYKSALKRLEEIEKLIDSDDTDIDGLAALTREARELLKFCKERLYKVETEVGELLKPDPEDEDL